MQTPRSVLESYCAGEFMPATDLRAAVAWMLAGWDEVMAAGSAYCDAKGDESRGEALTELLERLVQWDGELDDTQLDVTCTLALPAWLAQRGEAEVERLPYPRPTAT